MHQYNVGNIAHFLKSKCHFTITLPCVITTEYSKNKLQRKKVHIIHADYLVTKKPKNIPNTLFTTKEEYQVNQEKYI